jgi:spermidine synthase
MWPKIGRYHGWIFLILFFCSGATALIYEVIWSKYLSQMFGSTIQAQTVVLAVFMGGLALGNWLFGGKSDRFKRPVRVYGQLEMTIGLYAFFFHSIYSQADSLFVLLGTRWFEQPDRLLALKAGLATALLLGPTILMGGTLPLLAAWLQKNYSEAGRGSALFYGINSLGAVAGSGIAGFYLVQTLGMVASLQATALVNFAIGGIAFVLGKQDMQPQTQPQTQLTIDPGAPLQPVAQPVVQAKGNRPLRWAALMVAITGGVSMGLEVLASRGLSLIFGSSLQSFAIVLMAFILGIGLGSSVIASLKLRRISNEILIAMLLLVAAAWIGVLVLNIEGWVEFFRLARTGIARTTTGYIYNQWLSAAMSMFILGVPAALIGSVLPLLIRTLGQEQAHLGEHVGRLLTWNTIGAVTGVLLTGFIIMPRAGLRNAFIILALGLGVVGWIFAWRNQSRIIPSTVVAGLAAVMVFGGESWRHVMSSGVFRAREIEVNKDFMTWRKEKIQILFYQDAPDATVSVEKREEKGVTQIGLRINGKPDASSHGDLCTQLLVGHLPIFARPQSKDVFLLGMGSGITASGVLAHPIDKLVLAENCKPVIKAAELFAEYNRGVLTNSRMHLSYEDARTVLKLSPQQYDVIIAEPSNPWTVGVGSVFSKEFYEMCAGKLKDGGIMTQWFHVYEMHDGIVGLVLRTFGTVFPYFEIWDCNNGDIVMLGALKPWESTPEAYAAGINGRELVIEDLKRIGINSPVALFARQLASQKTAFAIAGEGPIQQDWMPVLEYQAPKAFFLGVNSRMLSKFDERTWQMENAPAVKRAALQKLSDADLKSVFTEHLSVNNDIVTFVRNNLSAPVQPNDPKRWVNFREPPFIFRPTNALPAKGAADLDEHEKALLQARQIIETNPKRHKEAVDTIARLLADSNADSKWPVATYAALAAKVSLRGGDYARAKELLQSGLKAKPDDAELQYLSRILDRFGG